MCSRGSRIRIITQIGRNKEAKPQPYLMTKTQWRATGSAARVALVLAAASDGMVHAASQIAAMHGRAVSRMAVSAGWGRAVVQDRRSMQAGMASRRVRASIFQRCSRHSFQSSASNIVNLPFSGDKRLENFVEVE